MSSRGWRSSRSPRRGVVGDERVWVENWDGLDLVVALGHHPRASARVWLDEAAEGTPKRPLAVCVEKVAGHKEHVVA